MDKGHRTLLERREGACGKDPNVSQLLYMDDIKLYARSEQYIDSLNDTMRIYGNDIGM